MPLSMFQEKAKIVTGIGAISNIILVSAGKGGVGKSVVAVNLALSLKREGFTVGLLDADLYGPSLKKMLGVDRFPQVEEECYFPALSQGIKIMSMAFFNDEEKCSAVRAPIANNMIQQLIKQVVWGSLDFLIVDTPPGTGDIPITLIQQLPVTGAVLVSTPQSVALLDVKKVVNMFSQMNVPVLGLLENMSYLPLEDGKTLSPFGRGGAKAFAEKQGIPFLGELPIDSELCAKHDRGETVFSNKVDSPIVKSFMKVASHLKALLIGKSHTDLKTIRIDCKTMPLKSRLSGVMKFHPELYEKSEGVLIKMIDQRDETSFSIEWTDETVSFFHFSELQKFCPCAGCIDKLSGERLSHLKYIPEELTAKQIEGVGSYAIRFQFVSGCSNGIYTFPFLKSLSRGSTE